ncbi:hypothetical protein ACH5RR_039996 [Cinchona calisaya]|uniref:sterol 22-desaturase n=1 Tax=Cinchona calisaya TaxID=153742 RepID=A0ABD2Y151_9GENT
MKPVLAAIPAILSESTSASPYLMIIITFTGIIALLLLVEQVSYLKKKRFLPGPTLVLPFFGNAFSLVTETTKFWDHQASLAKSSPVGVSTNYVLGRFLLYIYSAQLSHKVFTNIRPDAFQFLVSPFGKTIFGENSLMYMFGQEHKNLRRLIVPNFSPKALATYTLLQQRTILKHLKSWLQKSTTPIPLRLLCRDLNLETSQTVFVGDYLSDEERNMLNINYNYVNQGLLRLPINLPGFAFRKAILAREKLTQTLGSCAQKSRKRMENGEEEPSCLIDFWTQENLLREKDGDHLSYEELGNLLFGFLFAAQDATPSAMLWAIALLDLHPQVLQRVRSEVAEHWNPTTLDVDQITAEKLKKMKFTEAVVKEVLRMRPPGAIIPHIACGDFQLTDDYVVPKGTVIFPSVIDSGLQGFPEPDQFDPDRFMEERQEDLVHKRNFLAFGTGPHQCAGQRYAMNYMVLFVAMFATLMEFKRVEEDSRDALVYLPTIFPKDDCNVFLSPRCKGFPC